MFRQIKISYGLVAVLILLTIIQIISGSWSVVSYRITTETFNKLRLSGPE